MKPSEVLRAARKLIERPENWTRGADARDVDGTPVWAAHGDVEPVCWCSTGALMRVTETGPEYHSGRGFLEQVISPWRFIPQWNDAGNRTHPEVLAAFDRAIALAEAEESQS